MKSKKNSLQLLQEAYVKARPAIAIILVVAICISPMINDIRWKVGLTSALAVTCVFLLFDLFKSLNQRLDKIDTNLKVQEPPTYLNYNIAIHTIREIITDRLSHNQDVNLKVIGVSAQFTWKHLVEDTLPDLFKVGHRDPKIKVELLIVKPDVLEKWGQIGLKIDAETTLKRVPLFEKNYRSDILRDKISISVYEYDNIPHWHGIMIDDDIFFMGRCKWIEKNKRLHLQVGQMEYRQFSDADKFRGKDRIELFNQWFNAYKLRASFLAKIKEKGNHQPV